MYEKDLFTNAEKIRKEIRKELKLNPDHDNSEIFNYISKNLEEITFDNLRVFLQNNGFYPSNEDLTAIFSRYDYLDNNNILDKCEFLTIIFNNCGLDHNN